MPARIINIGDLQPTDTLRIGTISYLETLTPQEIIGLGMPQVWDTPYGLLISDGNHRVAALAQKGVKTLEADYIKISVDDIEINGLQEVIARAEQLRALGITNPYDLWQI